MATTHHLTGVRLNPVEIERPALDFDEAVTAHIMRAEGMKYQTIAQQLGTNTFRIGEILNGSKHKGAKQVASQLLAIAAE